MNQAEKNTETIRRGYAAFNAADMKTLTTQGCRIKVLSITDTLA
jgi:hypothetical protein